MHCLDFSPSLQGVSVLGLYAYAIWPAGWILPQRTGLKSVGHDWLATAGAVLACVETLGLQSVGNLAGDAHCDLATGVGMAGAVAHGTKRWGQVSGIGSVVLAAKGE